MTHVTGQSRYQTTMFPETLDELVPEDHPVRVIDAFVDSLLREDDGVRDMARSIAETRPRTHVANICE